MEARVLVGSECGEPTEKPMALTRIDCFFWGSDDPSAGSYVAFNPRHSAGSLVVAGSSAGREGIGGKVASKLALEQFAAGALAYFQDPKKQLHDKEPSIEALERAFKEANSSVYDFGHKLAAGGRLAASLFGLIVDSRLAAAGRAGEGGAYLARTGELFPFFEIARTLQPQDGVAERGIGVHSLVTVELASVALQPGDRIFLFSHTLESRDEHALLDIVRLGTPESLHEYREFMENLCGESGEFVYGGLCCVGPETMYLDRGLTAV